MAGFIIEKLDWRIEDLKVYENGGAEAFLVWTEDGHRVARIFTNTPHASKPEHWTVQFVPWVSPAEGEDLEGLKLDAVREMLDMLAKETFDELPDPGPSVN